jgi:predicted transcriptional regulator
MNITSYLPDELVSSLDRLAREQHSSRSAVIRQALEMYLQRQQAGAWPQRVREWTGDPDFPPFESLRGTEQAGDGDPFEGGAR